MALKPMLSQPLVHHEPCSKQGGGAAMRAAALPGGTLSRNLNRLLSAAVVSPRFCQLLLSDPAAALAVGYNGETFQLTAAEYEAVTSLQADTIRDFAAKLLYMLQAAAGEVALYVPEAHAEFRLVNVGTS